MCDDLYFFLLHKGDVRACQPPGSMLAGDVTQPLAVSLTMEIIIAAVGVGGEEEGPWRGSWD